MTGRIGAIIGLSQAAQRYPSVYIGQRAFAATQEARGHSVVGDRVRAEHMLDVAAQRADEIPGTPADAPPWNYDTPALITLERGLVQRQLGRNQAASDLLTAGMAALPAEHRDAEWTAKYSRALAEVQTLL